MSPGSMLMRLLPTRVRFALIRSQARLAPSDSLGMTFKLVDSPDEALAASRVVHRVYARRGLVPPHPSEMRVTTHGLLSTTSTFVARMGGRVVGTLALVGDGPLGLPLEGTYAAELAPFRKAGDRL